MQMNIWLADGNDFAVRAGLDGDLAAGNRQGIDRPLDRFAGGNYERSAKARLGDGGEIERVRELRTAGEHRVGWIFRRQAFDCDAAEIAGVAGSFDDAAAAEED